MKQRGTCPLAVVLRAVRRCGCLIKIAHDGILPRVLRVSRIGRFVVTVVVAGMLEADRVPDLVDQRRPGNLPLSELKK